MCVCVCVCECVCVFVCLCVCFAFAMAMYALAVVPLIRLLNDLAHQVWFADDASAGGCLTICWHGGRS